MALVALVGKHRRKQSLLIPTLLGSIGMFLLVGGFLLALEPATPKNEAIKTGGFAGGAVVALYALWLNDRRRRTDEARAEHDLYRVADERFARAIELLGHETTQVRVGAMHALAGLAKSRAGYTQTVLDILCAYLRRPYTERSDEELEVRLTAQRLIADLLPPWDAKDAPRYDLNLTKAYLNYFDISYKQVGELFARVAVLDESNAFHHMKIHGDMYWTEAKATGRLYFQETEVHGKTWFPRFASTGRAVFTGAKFLGETKFEGASFGEAVDLPEGVSCAG
ncbi:hypothetical protein Lesp02_54920 [Lentzea sp. NBRC 105346]|nr:hypothetical protein Lesp02_54920 [Lentzea sp. NBRC 105346]